MTVRASKFPSVQLENRQQERIERAEQNQPLLINSLLAENKQRMLNILNGNPEKREIRWDKQKEFMARRIRTVLSCNNDKGETN